MAKYVADQLTLRGTIDVLRGVTKMNGVSFRFAFFAPANGLTVSLWQRYRANRLTIVRQLHHSESTPADSVDIVLFVNGIPVATVELKNPLTGVLCSKTRRSSRCQRILWARSIAMSILTIRLS